MDEAHRYHADKSKKVINELKPKFGVELTATPFVPKNGNAVADKENDKGNTFKNIVYEYSLAAALADGKYIKEPAIATRQDFDKKDKSEDEIERIKLEDAVSVHEKTKIELQRYALESGQKLVKPFMFVVCKDTTHAKAVYDYVTSADFFKGQYASKALQIDSMTKTDDVEKQLLSIENTNNPIEIVIHVNMLKEGWDVSNLYTIVPLRAANALTLIEQTIGRGLRLPYGVRVNDEHVDKLTVISHDNFDKVIAASKDANSIFKRMKFIELDPNAGKDTQTLVTIGSRLTTKIQAEQARIETIKDEGEKQRALCSNDAKTALINLLPMVATVLPNVKSVADLASPEARTTVFKLLKTELENRPKDLFSKITNDDILASANEAYNEVVKDYTANMIEIPRLLVKPADPEAHFDDFDLDTSGKEVASKFEFHVFDGKIVRETLVDNKRDFIESKVGAYDGNRDTPEQRIVADLLLFPEVIYDKNATLLFKLAKQAIDAVRLSLRSDETIEFVVKENRKMIAGRIYAQMKKHFTIRQTGFQQATVYPFRAVLDWKITVPLSVGRTPFLHTVEPKSRVPKLVFMGFEKSYHPQYTFHSAPELEFSRVLERDTNVLKWLRPARYQFDIYWNNQSSLYEPDFVVETKDGIFMVEVKAANELDDPEVKDKARAARVYCETVSAYLKANGKKQWTYVILPHDQITSTSTFQYLVNKN
jgi:type III restriction enzyme